ncbi:MAG: hypothetical protein IJG88_00790, partial [Eggerthellaceae bacterium]|nr:hypothetical protein [Eggerthellaceae bacterium]
ACVGVACAGLLYLVLALVCRVYGSRKVMRFFPPIVTGPIIMCVGLHLAPSAINNCNANWGIAIVAIAVVIICNIWGRGMIKIIPILLGVIASYAVAAATGNVDFTAVKEAPWFGLPIAGERTVFSLGPGLIRYRCTLRMVVWPSAVSAAGVELGAPLELVHVRSFTVDRYRSGVVV